MVFFFEGTYMTRFSGWALCIRFCLQMSLSRFITNKLVEQRYPSFNTANFVFRCILFCTFNSWRFTYLNFESHNEVIRLLLVQQKKYYSKACAAQNKIVSYTKLVLSIYSYKCNGAGLFGCSFFQRQQTHLSLCHCCPL